jgi:hypothetical protein
METQLSMRHEFTARFNRLHPETYVIKQNPLRNEPEYKEIQDAYVKLINKGYGIGLEISAFNEKFQRTIDIHLGPLMFGPLTVQIDTTDKKMSQLLHSMFDNVQFDSFQDIKDCLYCHQLWQVCQGNPQNFCTWKCINWTSFLFVKCPSCGQFGAKDKDLDRCPTLQDIENDKHEKVMKGSKGIHFDHVSVADLKCKNCNVDLHDKFELLSLAVINDGIFRNIGTRVDSKYVRYGTISRMVKK